MPIIYQYKANSNETIIEKIVGEGEAIIPDKVIEIMNNAFQNCPKLESLTFPESLIFPCGLMLIIGSNAFHNREGLKSIIFIPDPNITKNYKSTKKNNFTTQHKIKYNQKHPHKQHPHKRKYHFHNNLFL